MHRWLLCAAALVAFGGSSVAEEPKTDDPVWRTDFAAAKALARRTGRPMFVVFR